MARSTSSRRFRAAPASQGPKRTSIWSAIHPQLLEFVRAHRSTLIFVNSRRLAERIAGAINELAGETLARAHHGCVAVAQRKEIEDQPKLGRCAALVATSSLELGIDMGAVDLVIQIESPPSVASGMQRVGRASHHVGAVSKAVIFPKYRADLVACAAITRAMYEGRWNRSTILAIRWTCWRSRSSPLVALAIDWTRGRASSTSVRVGRSVCVRCTRIDFRERARHARRPLSLRRIRRTAAAHHLGPRGQHTDAPRKASQTRRHPQRRHHSRPRPLRRFSRRSSRRARASANSTKRWSSRAAPATPSSWALPPGASTRSRTTASLVSPAPGEPGKMPFWHGDTAGRPLEFGRRIGELIRELREPAAPRRLQPTGPRAQPRRQRRRKSPALSRRPGRCHRPQFPSDADIVIETCRDEMGDRRVCVLTPFGSRIHAPWCMAVTAKTAQRNGPGSGIDVVRRWLRAALPR